MGRLVVFLGSLWQGKAYEGHRVLRTRYYEDHMDLTNMVNEVTL